MRRVLLIAFAYPPVQLVGSVRPAALAKYLPRFGWEATVLTPKLQTRRSSKSIVETEYRDVLEDWKARFHLDRKRGLHEELGRITIEGRIRHAISHDLVDLRQTAESLRPPAR